MITILPYLWPFCVIVSLLSGAVADQTDHDGAEEGGQETDAHMPGVPPLSPREMCHH